MIDYMIFQNIQQWQFLNRRGSKKNPPSQRRPRAAPPETRERDAEQPPMAGEDEAMFRLPAASLGPSLQELARAELDKLRAEPDKGAFLRSLRSMTDAILVPDLVAAEKDARPTDSYVDRNHFRNILPDDDDDAAPRPTAAALPGTPGWRASRTAAPTGRSALARFPPVRAPRDRRCRLRPPLDSCAAGRSPVSVADAAAPAAGPADPLVAEARERYESLRALLSAAGPCERSRPGPPASPGAAVLGAEGLAAAAPGAAGGRSEVRTGSEVRTVAPPAYGFAASEEGARQSRELEERAAEDASELAELEGGIHPASLDALWRAFEAATRSSSAAAPAPLEAAASALREELGRGGAAPAARGQGGGGGGQAGGHGHAEEDARRRRATAIRVEGAADGRGDGRGGGGGGGGGGNAAGERGRRQRGRRAGRPASAECAHAEPGPLGPRRRGAVRAAGQGPPVTAAGGDRAAVGERRFFLPFFLSPSAHGESRVCMYVLGEGRGRTGEKRRKSGKGRAKKKERKDNRHCDRSPAMAAKDHPDDSLIYLAPHAPT